MINAEIVHANNEDQSDVDIAIVGMSCRFPGACSLEEFWNNLAAGVESITRFQMMRSSGPACLNLSEEPELASRRRRFWKNRGHLTPDFSASHQWRRRAWIRNTGFSWSWLLRLWKMRGAILPAIQGELECSLDPP